jgi:hypothetical protein
MILFEGQTETVLGLVGGLLAELLRWFDLRYSLHQGLPDWSRSILYWVITFLMACAGALFVYVYILSGTKLNPILALNIGASAPLLLGKLIQQSPPMNPGSVN